ncbi:gliding motility-associated C-terminal domain-containing protein [Flavobacterium procerum]|uniref:Gliding motility-associated C-terminal domain-containing protein n=1 Tax=Flavobacterium procerum TaxID=1455569 RepID=A0ABV6BYP0_9FLAO
MKKYAVLLFILSILFFSNKTTAQYSNEHYIAPSPWQYWSDANELVITTISPGIVNATISKSDGTEIVTLALTASFPAVYRFEGIPMSTPRNVVNTVYNDRGLIVKSSTPIAVNVRNVASDEGNTGSDNLGNFIKGNASLVSFGDKGKGTAFRLGYYRTDFTGISGNAPVYSVMATEDNTQIFLDDAALTTLNTGQSFLFTAKIGASLTSNKMVVANAGAYSDAPGGCSDGIVTQVIPAQSLGKNYVIVRGNGTAGTQMNYPEQSTIIATQPNTVVKITNYDAQGIFLSTSTQTIPLAGGSYTFHHGDTKNIYSSSFVEADKSVIIYSGSADLCEVDMSTVIPVGDCTGSNEIVTSKFTSYNGNDLDAFGYIILASATEPVLINGSNLETLTGIPRTAIGTTGYYIIRFTNTEVGSPENYYITSNAKMTISIVQQGNGFTMSGFFSSFNETITKPEIVSNENCNTVISTQSGLAPYQWYVDGVAIPDAVSQTFTVKNSGNYTVTGTLDCGVTNQSSPLLVKVCSDLSVTKEIANLGNSNKITFLIKAKNNGPFQDTGVKVTDLLPNGYVFDASSTAIGTYNKTTGIWNIGTLDADQEAVLQISAVVNENGNHTNTAKIEGANFDDNQTNNTATVTPVWNMNLTKKAQQPLYRNIGEVIVYDLTLTNTGNVSLYNLSVLDANADTGSIAPAFIPALNPGENIVIKANHTITQADVNAKKVTNQATVVGESFVDIFIKSNSDDPTTPALRDATVTPVISEADLVTVKTDNKDYYIAGTNTIYTITVTNNGPGNAYNVKVNDEIPQGITVMNWSDDKGNSGNGKLDHTTNELKNGEVLTYTITIEVPETFTGNLTNTAIVTSSTTDPNPNCAACTDTNTEYVPKADLVTVKTDNQDYYVAGREVVYTISVKNNGPDTAKNVVVKDNLPAGISTMKWTDNLGNSGNGALNTILNELQNQASIIYTVTIAVPETFTGNLTNTAVVTSDTVDPDPSCANCTDVDAPYIPKADLVTVKTDNQDYYIPGKDVVYTISVKNNGPDTAKNVVVKDDLPTGISIMKWTDNLGNSGNGSLNAILNEVQNQASIIYTVTISVPADYKGDLTNTVVVSSDTEDPNPACAACTDTDLQCISPNPICTQFTDNIPNVISPNGDGKNDFFDLTDLPPITNLQIFNRFGHIVYTKQDYSNQWEGQSDKGERLPDGTYYYIIHFKDAKSTAGWVYISQ